MLTVVVPVDAGRIEPVVDGGSPLVRLKNHSGCASNTGFCVLLKSKRPITRMPRAWPRAGRRRRSRGPAAGTRSDSGTGRASGTARRCRPCSRERCWRGTQRPRLTSAFGSTVESVSLRLVWTNRIGSRSTTVSRCLARCRNQCDRYRGRASREPEPHPHAHGSHSLRRATTSCAGPAPRIGSDDDRDPMVLTAVAAGDRPRLAAVSARPDVRAGRPSVGRRWLPRARVLPASAPESRRCARRAALRASPEDARHSRSQARSRAAAVCRSRARSASVHLLLQARRT